MIDQIKIHNVVIWINNIINFEYSSDTLNVEIKDFKQHSVRLAIKLNKLKEAFKPEYKKYMDKFSFWDDSSMLS